MNINKNSQQNTGKLNWTTHQKNHTPLSSQFHSRDARMYQHTQIYKCNTAYKQKQRHKSHGHLNRYRKSVDKIYHPFMIKAKRKPGKEWMFLNITKAIYNKPIANIVLNWEQLKPFLLKSGTIQDINFPHYYCQYSFGISNQSNKTGVGIKEI
jgi:hypothetical protein